MGELIAQGRRGRRAGAAFPQRRAGPHCLHRAQAQGAQPSRCCRPLPPTLRHLSNPTLAVGTGGCDAQQVTPRKGPLRVLIADDHPLIRMSFRQDLEAAGITVCAEAGTGAEAIRAALAERPDLSLLDVRMPEGGGLAAAESIRRSLPATKVVLITAFPDKEGPFSPPSAPGPMAISPRTSAGSACTISSARSYRGRRSIGEGGFIRCRAHFSRPALRDLSGHNRPASCRPSAMVLYPVPRALQQAGAQKLERS